ncbi:MAG TPA: methyltransferase domain-containing protein [Kofleriaceae bacterium]|nr:methyltransferase domain-containing protein [Kofleriaceae bacterium]
MARAKDFDLAVELGKPSFTPGARDLPKLVELVVRGDEPAAPRAQAALGKLGAPARDAIAAALDAADDGARARLVTTLGLLARTGDDPARAALFARMADGSPRVRRAAIVALGKLGGDDARAALIARWDAGDVTDDERRALAEALGKVGGAEALARLQQASAGDDAELARRRDRALLMADRSARRDEASTIRGDVALPSPLRIRLGCRPGLAPLLVEELTQLALAPVSVDDAHADVTLERPLSTLFASRLWASCAIRLPAALPAVERGRRDDRVADPDALAAAITRAITAPATRSLLRALTTGPIRWRLGFAHGHKRAIVWRVARDVTAAAPELVNDPSATTWDVRVDEVAGSLELVPRRLDDPRFAWRVADVPAASHPTVAAALAWLAGAHDGDRVWDPFCGSGGELVERARRGPVRSLVGSDVDPTALEAARANVAAAGVTAELAVGDARTFAPGPVDLVITNPPLGSRVQLDAGKLLVDALPQLARQLAPGGRLVWITPAHRKTTPVAEQLGLRRTRWLRVDLGGVRGQLERWDRPR